MNLAANGGTRRGLVSRAQLRPPGGLDVADVRARSQHRDGCGGDQNPVTAADIGMRHEIASQRNVAVLFDRPRQAFGRQRVQHRRQTTAGFGRLDDVVHEARAG